MQGFLTIRKLPKGQRKLRVGDGNLLDVEAIGTLNLHMSTRKCIRLVDTLYVPRITRNLVSISRLDLEGYVIVHGCGKIAITHNNELLGRGFLDGLLYKLELDDNFSQSLLSLNIDDVTKTKIKSPK